MMNGKTTRRNFLQQTGLWAAAFAAGGSFAKRAQAARDKELNIYCWEGYNSDEGRDPVRREFYATVRAEGSELYVAAGPFGVHVFSMQPGCTGR